MWLGVLNYLPESRICLYCYVRVRKKCDIYLYFQNKWLVLDKPRKRSFIQCPMCQSTENFVTLPPVKAEIIDISYISGKKAYQSKWNYTQISVSEI